MEKKLGTSEQVTQADKWEWPEVGHASSDFEGSNALGYPPDWYQPEQPEEIAEPEEEIKPLTLEELEAIRQSAYEDGFAEGKEQGFTAGFDEGKQQGQEKGFQDGFEQGQQEGLAQGQHQIDERVAQWEALMERMAKPLHELDEQVEQQLVWMSMQLAKSILKTEPHIAPDLLLTALNDGIKLLPSAETGVSIELNPDDLAMVQEAYSEEACENRGWRLMPNPAMNRGDLSMVSDTSSIDLFLEQRIEQMFRQFMRQNLDLGS